MCLMLKYYGYVVDEGAVLFITIRSDVQYQYHRYCMYVVVTEIVTNVFKQDCFFTLTNTVKGPKGLLLFWNLKYSQFLK